MKQLTWKKINKVRSKKMRRHFLKSQNYSRNKQKRRSRVRVNRLSLLDCLGAPLWGLGRMKDLGLSSPALRRKRSASLSHRSQ